MSNPINVPVHVVATSASNEPLDVRSLTIRGTDLTVRMFEGYMSFNSVFGVAHKETLSTFGQIRGYVLALQTLVTLPEGAVIEEGFHCVSGVEHALNYFSAPKDEYGNPKELAYVNWRLLKNQARIDQLDEMGITKEGTEPAKRGYWLALSAKRNSFFPLWVNEPQTWAELVAFLGTKGITDPKAPEAKFIVDNYEKAWNIQNRHDAFEIILRMLAGKLFVGIKHSQLNEYDAQWLTREFNMLFKGQDEIRAHKTIKQENGSTQRKVERAAFAIAKSDSPELGEYAQAAIDGGLVTVFADGGVSSVKRAELVSKHIKFVYADGSRVSGTGSPFIKNDALLTAALQMAQSFSALIALA